MSEHPESAPQAPRRDRLRRPVQRARDQLRHRRQRARGDRPRRRTTWCRSGSPPTAAGCSSPATPSGSQIKGPDQLPERRRRPRVDRAAARGRRHRPRRPRAGAAARRRSARSTWSSRCCTGRGARTAPSRGCSRWPASATSARACSRARSAWTRRYMKVVLAGGRAAGAAVGDGDARASGTATRTASAHRSPTSASRCS